MQKYNLEYNVALILARLKQVDTQLLPEEDYNLCFYRAKEALQVAVEAREQKDKLFAIMLASKYLEMFGLPSSVSKYEVQFLESVRDLDLILEEYQCNTECVDKYMTYYDQSIRFLN